MIKTARKCLLALAFFAAALSAVVLVRTFTWKSAQLAVEPVSVLAIDDGAVARLSAAIRARTVSGGEGAQTDSAAFDAFHRLLETSYPLVHADLTREVVGGHSLLFTWKGEDASAPPVLLLAHMDTVPVEPGTESSWARGPFSGDVADGFVWGRGTLDDKGSVTAILEAVETLLKRGFRPKQAVLLAFGHDEEIGGQAGAGRIAALLRSRGVRAATCSTRGRRLPTESSPASPGRRLS